MRMMETQFFPAMLACLSAVQPGALHGLLTPGMKQQPVGRVGNPKDIANMVLYLCSDMAGFITGENICIDGGMTRQMIYHGDWNWSLNVKNSEKE